MPDVHRFGDVLEPLRPDRRQLDIDFAAHLLVDGARDAYATGRRQRFQPRRDIDAVAEDVFAVDDDVADIDAHAQAQPTIFRVSCAALAHVGLNGERRSHRGNSRRKLDQESVAHGLDQAPAGGRDPWVDDFGAQRPQARDDAFFISSHLAAEADNICDEDGGQASVHERPWVTQRRLG